MCTRVLSFMLALVIPMACSPKSATPAAENAVLAEHEGHTLRSRHVLAALHIAEDISFAQNGSGLDDQARANVELGVLGEFQRDPARTAADLERLWASLDAGRRAELFTSWKPGPGLPQPASTVHSQWLARISGKLLVHSNSTSAGYDGLSIANVLVERFAFHSDKRFEMTSGSSAAGVGMEQVAIDEYMVGTWSLESISANEAVVHVSASGQALAFPLTLSNGQLFLVGEPVAVYTL